MSNWMACLPTHLLTCPISSLAIPGSHNSLSFYADKDSNVDRNIAPIFRQYVEHFGEMAAEISHRWTTTQSTTVTQQLDYGVRYFDLRVTARSGDDKNVFFRNGPNILPILKEFRRWADLHPQEVIILDFRVVHRLSPAQHRYLLANMTQDVFEDKMLECTGHVNSVSLRNMWAIGAQFIVFYPQQCVYDYKTVWPNNYLEHFNCDCLTYTAMLDDLDTRYSQDGAGRMFHCLNAVMTPSNDYLATKLHKTLKDNLSKPALRAIIYWIHKNHIQQGDVNIITADFVNLFHFCREVIRVNYRNSEQDVQSRTCTLL